ncbi:MAG: hypothetical protein ACK5ZG_10695 [Phycisphaerae bacterium]|jgi:hypothetical protein
MVPTAAQPAQPSQQLTAMPREALAAIAPGSIVTPARRNEQSNASRDDAKQRGDDTYEPQPREQPANNSAFDVESFDQEQVVARSMAYLRQIMDPDPPDGFASPAERAAAENARRLASGQPPPEPGASVDITA